MYLLRLIGLAILIAVVMIVIGLSVYFGFIIYFLKEQVKKFRQKFS